MCKLSLSISYHLSLTTFSLSLTHILTHKTVSTHTNGHLEWKGFSRMTEKGHHSRSKGRLTLVEGLQTEPHWCSTVVTVVPVMETVKGVVFKYQRQAGMIWLTEHGSNSCPIAHTPPLSLFSPPSTQLPVREPDSVQGNFCLQGSCMAYFVLETSCFTVIWS